MSPSPAPPVRRGAVPSLLKWTGSKRSQAAQLAAYVPAHGRYYEPFLGGGAMLYTVGRPGAVGADIYPPLIAFWHLVRDDVEHLIDDYSRQWRDLQRDLPGYFYSVRARFNQQPTPEDLNFLMRVCVNGIVRFSKTGAFNNSFHLSRRGMAPERFATIARAWSAHIAGMSFRHGDYRDTTADARAGDFIYLDPPYAGNRHRYIGDLDLDRFFETLDAFNRRGIKWALSFDGTRGDTAYTHPLPAIFRRHIRLRSGHSAVKKVLDGPVEMVTESLYLNF